MADLPRDDEQACVTLRRSEAELRSAVGELAVAARREMDPREWIARRPLAWLAAGLVVGLWMARRRAPL